MSPGGPVSTKLPILVMKKGAEDAWCANITEGKKEWNKKVPCNSHLRRLQQVIIYTCTHAIGYKTHFLVKLCIICDTNLFFSLFMQLFNIFLSGSSRKRMLAERTQSKKWKKTKKG